MQRCLKLTLVCNRNQEPWFRYLNRKQISVLPKPKGTLTYDVSYCSRSNLFHFNNTITELHDRHSLITIWLTVELNDRHSLKTLHLPLPFLMVSGPLKNKSLLEGKSLSETKWIWKDLLWLYFNPRPYGPWITLGTRDFWIHTQN